MSGLTSFQVHPLHQLLDVLHFRAASSLHTRRRSLIDRRDDQSVDCFGMSVDASLPEEVLVGFKAIEDHIRSLSRDAEVDKSNLLKQYQSLVTSLLDFSNRHNLRYPIGG